MKRRHSDSLTRSEANSGHGSVKENQLKPQKKKQLSESIEENPESPADATISEEEEDLDDIYDPFLHSKKAKKNDDAAVNAASGTMAGGDIMVILDIASLEIVKTKKGDFQLLNCDDHISLIRKYKKDPSVRKSMQSIPAPQSVASYVCLCVCGAFSRMNRTIARTSSIKS